MFLPAFILSMAEGFILSMAEGFILSMAEGITHLPASPLAHGARPAGSTFGVLRNFYVRNFEL